jgi:Protein of unknown function (DUF2911)
LTHDTFSKSNFNLKNQIIMNKFLKRTLIVVASLAVLLFVAFKFMQYNTKKASPEATVEFKKDGTEVSVFYCRPSKRGREIFGGIVPLGKVWRTGANEASTVTTNKDIVFGGKTVPAGKYTLWTIPTADHWTVILNNKQYNWGVTLDSQASRDATADVASVDLPTEALADVVEQFTISFDEAAPAMILAWDKTKVTVPLK